MSFKTTPAPVAKERSQTVYTNNISFKTTPAPGAKQRSRTVYTRNIPFKRHRLPEPNNGPGPLQVDVEFKTASAPGAKRSRTVYIINISFKNDTGSRSRTVPDRYTKEKKYLAQNLTRLPEPNKRSRTVHK